jgi:hypothetical protein
VAQRVPIVPSLQNEAAAIIHKPMTVTATNTQMTNVVSSGVFCSHRERDMNSSSRTFERHPVTPHQQQLHAAATHSKIYAILEHRLISTNQHRPNYVTLSAVALCGTNTVTVMLFRSAGVRSTNTGYGAVRAPDIQRARTRRSTGIAYETAVSSCC